MARLTSTIACALAASLATGAAYAADAALIEAARKEGEVNWYSTQIISQLVRPVTAAFEKKYPGIKVRATRANATEVAVKILNESRAGRVQSDIFDGTTTVVPLKKEGYRAAVAAGCRQGLSGRREGPGRLLDRQQPVHHHAGFNTSAGAARQRAARPIRTCSIRNGAASWPGTVSRPAPASAVSSARC